MLKSLLVVANRTLSGWNLAEFLDRRAGECPGLGVHVLVPLPRSMPLAGFDLGGGMIYPDLLSIEAERACRDEAQQRLDLMEQWLRSRQVMASGELSEDEPVHAIGCVLDGRRCDEIVISTLPLGLSRWLHLDLPHRVERRFARPVVTIVDDLRLRDSAERLFGP